MSDPLTGSGKTRIPAIGGWVGSVKDRGEPLEVFSPVTVGVFIIGNARFVERRASSPASGVALDHDRGGQRRFTTQGATRGTLFFKLSVGAEPQMDKKLRRGKFFDPGRKLGKGEYMSRKRKREKDTGV
jgi:hypothetical protein